MDKAFEHVDPKTDMRMTSDGEARRPDFMSDKTWAEFRVLPKEERHRRLPELFAKVDDDEIEEQVDQMIATSQVNVFLVFVGLGVILGFVFGIPGWTFLAGGILMQLMMNNMTRKRIRK